MSRLADLSDPSVYKLKRSGRPAGRGGIGRNTTQVGHVCQEPALDDLRRQAVFALERAPSDPD
jgi:hypothetical protein